MIKQKIGKVLVVNTDPEQSEIPPAVEAVVRYMDQLPTPETKDQREAVADMAKQAIGLLEAMAFMASGEGKKAIDMSKAGQSQFERMH